MKTEQELNEVFSKTGIETTVSTPQYIEKQGSEMGKVEYGKGWPCIRFNVTFTKGAKSFNVDWHVGLGLIPMPMFKDSRDADILRHIKQGKNLKDKSEQREVATRCAREGKKKMVNPAEVFARILADYEMTLRGFNEFCADLGYDSDKISHLKIYQEIQTQGKGARALVDNETGEKLIELVNEL